MRKLQKDILIGFFITVGILLLAELGLRIFWKVKWPQDQRWWSYGDELGGVRYVLGKYELNKSPIGFAGNVNSLGYRGPEWSIQKDKNVYRIVCVGDSVVLGLRSTKTDADFPHQLEIILNQELKGKNIRYEVLNAGLGSNNSSQSLYRLQNELLSYHPDMVIVSVGMNDINETNPYFPSSYHKEGFVRKLTKHSFLVRTWVGLLFKVIIPKIPLSQKELEAKKEVFSKFVPNLYFSNFTNMVKICKDKNVKIVFLTLATLATNIHAEQHINKIRIPSYMRSLFLYQIVIRRYNENIHQVGLRENVPVIDLCNFFDNLPNADEYYVDHVHFNDTGYKLYAKKLAEELRGKKILPGF